MISVKVDDDQKKQTADRTFDVMLSSDPAGTDFIPRKTWSFTIPPNDLDVKPDPSMGPARFRKGTAMLRFTTDGLQNSKTFAVSSTDTRIAVRTGLITIDKDPFDFFDVVLSPAEGAELEIKETIELEISHLDAFSRDGAQVSAGLNHTCAIRDNNTVACWGIQTQVNLTNASHLSTFNDVSNRRFSAVSAGHRHTCGILMDDGTAACWGDRASGQSTPTESPQKVEGTEKFLAVSAGRFHTCGIRVDSTAACWGDPTNNRLDPTKNFQDDVTAATKFLAVSAGENHTCGIRIDSTVACWGDNARHQLDLTRNSQGVTTAAKFLAVSTGGSHSCGILIDGTVKCWGDPTATDLMSSPQGVTTDTKFLVVESGFSFSTCGIRADRTVACWGSDALGDSSTSPTRSTSVQGGPIKESDEFLAVSTGSFHTCAIRITGAAACWSLQNFPRSQPPDGFQARVIPDTFYLLEKRDMNVPLVIQSAVRLRIKVFLEGALR